MIPSQESIQTSAEGMVRNFGAEAHVIALVNVKRFGKTRDPNDAQGVRNWLAIAAAIEVLDRNPTRLQRRDDGLHT